MVVFFGIVCSIIAMAWVLALLNRLYVRITGSESSHSLPPRVEEEPQRRARDATGDVRARGRDPGLRPARRGRDGGLVLLRRRLTAALPVATDWSVNQSAIVTSRRCGCRCSGEVGPAGRRRENRMEGDPLMASNGKFQGREVVIVEAVRTPIGRGHEEKGYYKDVHASNLLAKTYKELIDRAGIDAAEVEDVVTGCVQQFGEQGLNIGRNAWLEAGLPIETPATTIDRQCGSAQQAVNFAAALVASGVHDAAIGGGVEHMGHISFADSMSVQKEHGFAFSPELLERYNLVPQGISAEMIADKWEIPALRARRDRPALPSARRQGHRGGSLRARDRPLRGQRRHLRHRPGDPPGHQPREALGAEARLQGGRQDHRRELLPDLRRRRRGAADDPREGRRARPRAARPDRRPDHGGRRPRDHAHRADPRDAEAPRAQRDEDRTTST